MRPVFEELASRGFIAQCTDDRLSDLLEEKPFTVYVGFDPTADSLHLGHLVPIMALSHFQRAGHKVLAIVGGATGMVGDPSGRSDERNLLGPEQVAKNAAAIKTQLAHFITFDGPNAAVMLDNNDWISRMSFVDWLREVGKYFTVNYMLAKESVSQRLNSEQGLSFTEFAYMTMQAFDFLHLFDQHGCRLQCGGSDQWGNITAGLDLIRKLRQQPAYGLTFPLVTTSAGAKFGKSAGNAVWLDRTRTTPWDLYQYLIRQDDRDVIRFLKLYTFLEVSRIDELELALKEAPGRREAHRSLAFEVTQLLHGEATATEIAKAADLVYSGEIHDLDDETVASAFADAPKTELTRPELSAGIEIVDLLVLSGLTPSKGEAARLVKGGGAYVNNVRVGPAERIGAAHLASASFIVLRTGKKNYCLVKVV